MVRMPAHGPAARCGRAGPLWRDRIKAKEGVAAVSASWVATSGVSKRSSGEVLLLPPSRANGLGADLAPLTALTNVGPPLLSLVAIVDFFPNSKSCDCFDGSLLWQVFLPPPPQKNQTHSCFLRFLDLLGLRLNLLSLGSSC